MIQNLPAIVRAPGAKGIATGSGKLFLIANLKPGTPDVKRLLVDIKLPAPFRLPDFYFGRTTGCLVSTLQGVPDRCRLLPLNAPDDQDAGQKCQRPFFEFSFVIHRMSCDLPGVSRTAPNGRWPAGSRVRPSRASATAQVTVAADKNHNLTPSVGGSALGRAHSAACGRFLFPCVNGPRHFTLFGRAGHLLTGPHAVISVPVRPFV